LWKGLLAELEQMADAQFEESREDYEAYSARRDAGQPTKLDLLWPTRPPRKVIVVLMESISWHRKCFCRECGQAFFTERQREICSHRCRTAILRRRRKQTLTKRSAARAAARCDTCLHCGEPMDAQRSTAKFCSAKCRVYAARERKRLLSRKRG
jgi:predicted nucleic acid-binding Zn ribbon protein